LHFALLWNAFVGALLNVELLVDGRNLVEALARFSGWVPVLWVAGGAKWARLRLLFHLAVGHVEELVVLRWGLVLALASAG
jgi:hypothetical protein